VPEVERTSDAQGKPWASHDLKTRIWRYRMMSCRCKPLRFCTSTSKSAAPSPSRRPAKGHPHPAGRSGVRRPGYENPPRQSNGTADFPAMQGQHRYGSHRALCEAKSGKACVRRRHLKQNYKRRARQDVAPSVALQNMPGGSWCCQAASALI
jgi:hypothetical protein